MRGCYTQSPRGKRPRIDSSNGQEVMYYLKKEYYWPSADKWIKNMWYIATIVYYSAIKKNHILPFAPTWMDFEAK